MNKKLPNHKFWKNKKIFLTGHTSFKGTWLKIWLESLGAKVKGYSIDYPSKPICFFRLIHKKKIKSEDILNNKYLKKKLKQFKPNIVIHMAAQSILSEANINPLDNYRTNVIGTASLIQACCEVKSIKLVSVVTTDKCYQDTENIKYFTENSTLGGSEPYSSSKACAEIISKSYSQVFKKLNKKIITLRGGNVVGGGDWKKDRLVPDILRAVKIKKTLRLRNPDSTRPWQHVLDCLNGYLLASEYAFNMKKTYDTWNFSPPRKNQIKVIDFVNKTINFFNYPKSKIKYKKTNLYETKNLNLSSKKANQEIKWSTILSQNQLIDLIVKWYYAYFEKQNMKTYSLKQIKFFYKLGNGVK